MAEAFDVPDLAKEPRSGVGPVQPWVFARFFEATARWLGGGIAAVFLLLFVFVSRDQTVVLKHTFTDDDIPSAEPVGEGATDPPPVMPTRLRTFVSEPIELTGRDALEVRTRAGVSNSWAWVEGAIINEESGEAALFGMETAYYHGFDGGEAWSEGSTEASRDLASLPRGRYIVRADLQWDPGSLFPPTVHLEVRQGGWSFGQFFWALLAVLSPLLLLVHRRSFEKQRWSESTYG